MIKESVSPIASPGNVPTRPLPQPSSAPSDAVTSYQAPPALNLDTRAHQYHMGVFPVGLVDADDEYALASFAPAPPLARPMYSPASPPAELAASYSLVNTALPAPTTSSGTQEIQSRFLAQTLQTEPTADHPLILAQPSLSDSFLLPDSSPDLHPLNPKKPIRNEKGDHPYSSNP